MREFVNALRGVGMLRIRTVHSGAKSSYDKSAQQRFWYLCVCVCLCGFAKEKDHMEHSRIYTLRKRILTKVYIYAYMYRVIV